MGYKRILFFIAFLVITADCSEVDLPCLQEGYYDVKSDCQDVTTSNGETKLKRKSSWNAVTSDYDLKDAEDYGFPTNAINHWGPHKIVANGEGRICKAFIFKKNAGIALFSCFDKTDSNKMVCTIHLSFVRELTD